MAVLICKKLTLCMIQPPRNATTDINPDVWINAALFRRWGIPRLVAMMSCIGMITFSATAFGPVEISGKIESEYYNSRGVMVNTGVTGFKVIVDGTGWQITTSQAGSAAYSIASDGKATYTLISNSDQTNISDDAAQIDSVSIPLATPAELIPWYFYVLKRSDETILPEVPLPWTTPRNDSQAYFCDNKITWSDAEPRLLDKAIFTFSERKVMVALASRFLDLSSPPVVSAANANLLAKSAGAAAMAGECSVTEWSNTMFGTFPQKFKVNVYDALIDHNAGSAKGIMRIRYMGTAIEIRKADSISYTPSLQRPIWTRDYRFRDASKGIEALRYGPSKAWLTNKSEVDQSRAEIVQSAYHQRQNSSISRYVFLCLFLLISIIPIILLLKRPQEQNVTNKGEIERQKV